MNLKTCLLSIAVAALAAEGLLGCAKEVPRYIYVEKTDGPLWQRSGRGDATEAFGLATVSEGEFDAEASVRPWSGWWYPQRGTILFQETEKGPAPLQKYDQWVERTQGVDSTAADFERQKFYDPQAADWAGLCDAWSAASILEPEPVAPAGRIDGIRFTTGDLKALVIKSYENVKDLRKFGQRYNGERGDDYDDISPDQFHRVLQHELFEEGRPFIMDVNPGIEVWNFPVYKAHIQITADPHDAHVMHVDAQLTTASPFVDPDYVGTFPVSREYTYDLYGIRQADGSFEVRAGKWTGHSMDDHPDFLTVLPNRKPEHFSRNDQIKTEYVETLMEKARSSAGTANGR